MSVRREGNGKRPWRVRWYDSDGHERQRSFPTKRLAEEFQRDRAEEKARIRAGLPVQQGPIAYTDLCELYLAGYTAASKGWFEQMLGYSRDRWGPMPVHLIRPEQVAKWLHTDLARLSPKTRTSILAAMRQVCTAAVEWGYLHQSPVRPAAVRAPKRIRPAVFPLQSWEEVLAVAGAAGHYGPLIRFVCSTGLRFPEWAGLEWADVDPAAGIVTVRGEKTKAAHRAVVLPRPAARALEELVRRIDSPLIFTTPTGLPINTRKFGEKVWKGALAEAGLEARPARQMRHTYATLALAQGCSLEWISRQMGHSSITITLEHYARFVKRVDDRMRALLDDLEVDNELAVRHP